MVFIIDIDTVSQYNWDILKHINDNKNVRIILKDCCLKGGYLLKERLGSINSLRIIAISFA
jgi:hypothetical protein